MPSDEAKRQLESLLTKPRLKRWHWNLRQARHAQRIVQREMLYIHPAVKDVTATLANLKPANPADLSALTLDHLWELRKRIRDGNTDIYKQFWNEDSHRHPTEPKAEDSCRDTLLEKLQYLLGRIGVDAQPEGHYADEKRSDVRISYGGALGFNVPIEIKKDRHANLWSAIRDQLITRYVRDPGAAGYGIYLVFWFGIGGIRPRLGGLAAPSSPRELEDQLRNSLTSEEQRLIKVCVIDVAKPLSR
jgi:hypothetical protein